MKYLLSFILACLFFSANSQNLLEFEVFEIPSQSDTLLITRFGTKITINHSSFKYLDDTTSIESNITLKVKEIVDQQDMVLEGVTTNSKEGILVSNGMISIEAFSNQSKLELDTNQSIRIEIPANSGLTDMSVYEMTDSTNNWKKSQTKLDLDTCASYKQRILTRNKTVSKKYYKKWVKEQNKPFKNWKKYRSDSDLRPAFGGRTTGRRRSYYIPVPFDTIWTCNNYDLSQYSFNINSLGWYNIDKLKFIKNPMNLIVSTDEDLDLFLIFENENICIRASKKEDGKYLFRNIPSRGKAKIIGYKQNSLNDANVVIHDLYLNKGEIKLKPSKKVTLGELKRLIKLNK